MGKIYFFNEYDNNGYMSNWYESTFTVDGITYKTTEQYFMAKKALTFNDKETYKMIINAATPKEAKDLGRLVKNYDGSVWEKLRESVMFEANLYKFTQNDELKALLLSTGDSELFEASPYDKIWGIGIDETSAANGATSTGLNLMGKCLEKVRSAIK